MSLGRHLRIIRGSVTRDTVTNNDNLPVRSRWAFVQLDGSAGHHFLVVQLSNSVRLRTRRVPEEHAPVRFRVPLRELAIVDMHVALHAEDAQVAQIWAAPIYRLVRAGVWTRGVRDSIEHVRCRADNFSSPFATLPCGRTWISPSPRVCGSSFRRVRPASGCMARWSWVSCRLMHSTWSGGQMLLSECWSR